jgi:hypothetical protein
MRSRSHATRAWCRGPGCGPALPGVVVDEDGQHAVTMLAAPLAAERGQAA